MSKRSQSLESLANTITGYRLGEIDSPDQNHVNIWVKQFDTGVQEAILTELDYVLKQTYIPKNRVEDFLASLVTNKEFAGEDPCSFWKGVNFLSIQARGNSQREMLAMFGSVLQDKCGLNIDDCGGDSGVYVYIDDGVFTGNRIRNDLSSWIESDAPQKATIHIVVMALHRSGQYYARSALEKVTQVVGKEIVLLWWRVLEVEDRRSDTFSSDVLRPTGIPDDELTQNYVDSMEHKPVLRNPGSVGRNKFFSSEEGRNILEQELLKAGVQIRSMSPNLNVYQRPLGNMVLETLGFGSLLVTFRNCPNNCPLALWAGDPWYPLFPRSTNSDSFMKYLLEHFGPGGAKSE